MQETRKNPKVFSSGESVIWTRNLIWSSGPLFVQKKERRFGSEDLD